MPSVRKFDWQAIRAEYEAGASMGKLAEKYGLSKPAISKRAKKENWTQDPTEAVNRLVNAKVNGLVNTVNPIKKAEALDNAAQEKVAVILRHRQEWAEFKPLFNEALTINDYNVARRAKLLADALQTIQAGERKAWGIIDVDVRPRDETATPRLNLILSNAAPVNE